MDSPSREVTLRALAEQLGCPYEGDGDVVLRGVAALAEAGPGDLTFLRSAEWVGQLSSSKASAVIAPAGIDVEDRPVIRSGNPGLHFGRAVAIVVPHLRPDPGIHPMAWVDPTATVDPSASIGPHCSVGARTVIGARTVLHPNVTVYPDTRIGEDCTFHSSCVVHEGTRIGDRVVVKSCAVLGGEGFGHVFDEDGGWEHTPHVGCLVIEDDVEIGGNSGVDRATLGEARIGRGTKIDSHVFIGHNCKLGERVIMCGQAAIAGSVTLEDRVIFMAGAGATGHITVGEGAFVGGKAGLTGDIAPGARVWGVPEMEEKSWLRASMHFARLPEMAKRLRAIEKHLGLRKFKGKAEIPSELSKDS